MKELKIIIVLLLMTYSDVWTQENYFGISGMPWNTEPERVIAVFGIPDLIFHNGMNVIWLDRNYFTSRYESLAEQFGIDSRKTINDIINEYDNIQFVYYNNTVYSYRATMWIYFENKYASRERYEIDIDDLSTTEKNRIYNLFKTRLERELNEPASIRESNIFKTIKWEKYYTNIELELYIASSGSGTYLRLDYERSNASRQLAGMGLEIIDTGKLYESMNFDQFSNIIEDFKRSFRQRGMEVGDLVPNSQSNDPLTVGINHILHTTNHRNNELWVTHLYFERLNASARIYVLFSDRAVGGYYFRGIILIE